MPYSRDKVMALLGDFPARVEPTPEIIAHRQMKGYSLDTIAYDVEPGERINAYLLTSDGLKGAAPGIVAIHQHAGQFYLGKSEPAGLSVNATYHYGKDLCLRGFVVICPDLLCFEDRRPPEFERAENTRLQDAAYERSVASNYLFRGSTLQAKYLHDLGVTIDVLSRQPTVDAHRIGCIGHSLGGQQAMWLTWYDKRIKAGVSSCGFSMVQAILRDHVLHNMAFYVPGLLKVCDLDEIVAAIAPRAFMMAAGAQDRIFPIDAVQHIGEFARKAYQAVGAPDAFACAIFDGGHGFSDEMKALAYPFLARHLSP